MLNRRPDLRRLSSRQPRNTEYRFEKLLFVTVENIVKNYIRHENIHLTFLFQRIFLLVISSGE